ncbi:uncharacterized, partial [Tachysurus ichikawai]
YTKPPGSTTHPVSWIHKVSSDTSPPRALSRNIIQTLQSYRHIVDYSMQ